MALHDHERILVFGRWGIGDLVLQWPVLESVRRAAPDARITLMAADPAARLLDGVGAADAIRTYQEFGIRHVGQTERAAGIEAWFGSQRFDGIADVLTAPPCVRPAAWRIPARHYETDRGTVSAVLRAGGAAGPALAAGAAAGWGLPTPVRESPRPGAWRDGRDRAAEILARVGLESGFVALIPFASHPLKRWPADRFAAVARRMLEAGESVAVFAAPDDDAAAEVAARCRPDRPAVIPPTDLRTLAAVLARAAVCVGNDTGVMHMAAAAGRPAVAIFGPSDARAYAPGGRVDLAAPATAPCPIRQAGTLSPPGCWVAGRCLNRCGPCIDQVSVDDVLERLRTARETREEQEAA